MNQLGQSLIKSEISSNHDAILSKLSSDGPCPIEIDEQIYYIPSAVNQLIENLYRQACDFQKGENGTPQNKE